MDRTIASAIDELRMDELMDRLPSIGPLTRRSSRTRIATRRLKYAAKSANRQARKGRRHAAGALGDIADQIREGWDKTAETFLDGLDYATGAVQSGLDKAADAVQHRTSRTAKTARRRSARGSKRASRALGSFSNRAQDRLSDALSSSQKAVHKGASQATGAFATVGGAVQDRLVPAASRAGKAAQRRVGSPLPTVKERLGSVTDSLAGSLSDSASNASRGVGRLYGQAAYMTSRVPPEAKYRLFRRLASDKELMERLQGDMESDRSGRPRFSPMTLGGVTLAALGLGAGLMYVFDPQWGHHRRTQIRDRSTHLLRQTGDAFSTTTSSIGQRARDFAGQAQTMGNHSPLTDEEIVSRVRAELGRAVSNPLSIQITSMGGQVTLSGPILADEIDRALQRVANVRDVTGIENRLEVYSSAEGVPGLVAPGAFDGAGDTYGQGMSPGLKTLAIAGGILTVTGLGILLRSRQQRGH